MSRTGRGLDVLCNRLGYNLTCRVEQHGMPKILAGSKLPSLRASSEIIFRSLAVRPCEASWKSTSNPSGPALRRSALDMAVRVGIRWYTL